MKKKTGKKRTLNLMQLTNQIIKYLNEEHDEESDVDVRIERDESMPFNLHDLFQFAKRIERMTGRKVDVVSTKDLKNESLAAAIEREKVLVYERAQR